MLVERARHTARRQVDNAVVEVLEAEEAFSLVPDQTAGSSPTSIDAG
jgi:hypothetical protein